MTSSRSMAARAAAALSVTVAVVAAASIAVSAAEARKPPPLMLEERGNFWVGGERVPRTQPGSEDFEQIVGQAYVEYSIPYHKRRNAPPIVLSSPLSGVLYSSTPDGREGWTDFFVRRGYPVYVVDFPGIGRAGFSVDPFNRVQAGIDPPSSLPFLHRYDTDAWREWNQGPQFGVHGPADPTCIGNDGQGDPPVTCHGNRFPNDDASLYHFLASFAPLDTSVFEDITVVPPPCAACERSMVALLERIGPAILIGHSFSGAFGGGLANTRPDLFGAVIGVEPAENCLIAPTAAVAGIAQVPALSIHGLGQVGRPNTPACKAKYAEIDAAGGNATYLDLVHDLGIWGNGHLPMWEDNSDQIAQILLDWIKSNV
jgi:pimeloyl-ACP methyl ester carboxylesterase